MARTIALLAAALLSVGAAQAQDAPALIEKLKAKDEETADTAQADLLKLGAGAVAPLREAAAKSEDADFRKRAVAIADRLETRQAAAGIAASWGDRWYSVFIGAVHVGWARLRAEEKEGKVVFTDEVRIQVNKDIVFEVRVALTCEPDEYLSLRSVTLDIGSPEQTVQATGQVKEGRLVVKTGGDVKAHKIAKNTVADFAAFRLVTLLPRTEGYEIELLELIKPKLPVAATVKFDKEESIEFEEKKVKTRRFVLADGQSKDRYYWVDGRNRLLRMQSVSDDDKEVEIQLSDEKRAKDIDTK